MPNHKSYSATHVEIIHSLCAQGLKAKDIFNLKRPEFQDFPVYKIQKILGKEGLADPKRRHGRLNAHYLTEEEIQRLESLFQNGGLTLPDRAIAKRLGITVDNVENYRRRHYGKVTGKPRSETQLESSRRKNISIQFVQRRKQFYAHMCKERTRLILASTRLPARVCNVCKEPWYASTQFYYYTGMFKADGITKKFYAACRLCMREIGFLRRLGKTEDEILSLMSQLYVHRPLATTHELTLRLSDDCTRNCKDPLHACTSCGKSWFCNDRYFVTACADGKKVITNTCLACNVVRRFYSR
jgi:hypothetical protein